MSGKILFVESRTGGDFTMDAIWAGLIDRFGYDNIIDYPSKLKHREGIPTITGNVEDDYGAERRSLCYTPFGSSMKCYNVDQINYLLKNGDIGIIITDERKESFALLCRTIALSLDVPIVVIAGHDRFWNDGVDRPWNVLRKFYRNLKALFIDNWVDEYYNGISNVFPMSYSINFDHLWNTCERRHYNDNKLYDVCFAGYNSHPVRKIIVDHLKNKYDNSYVFIETRNGIMDSFLQKKEYFKKMAQSKVCINIKGAAECGKALRFYEIPYVGSFMLSQRFGGRQVHPFIDNIHCMYFDELKDMDEKIQWALNNDNEREKMAINGYKHVMMYHTARARVDYIFNCLRELA